MNRFHRTFWILPPMLALLACTPEAPDNTAKGAKQEPATTAAVSDARTPEQALANGERVYRVHCAACHQASGQGLGGAFPPLAGSDYLEQGHDAVIRVVLQGLRGPITVNGVDYDGVMPNLSYLSDQEVADVVTYVFNAWGHAGGVVEPGQVAALREE